MIIFLDVKNRDDRLTTSIKINVDDLRESAWYKLETQMGPLHIF